MTLKSRASRSPEYLKTSGIFYYDNAALRLIFLRYALVRGQVQIAGDNTGKGE